MQFYKTKQFVACRNLQVISMRFAVFLCYSVRLFIRNSVQFCSIRTPLHPPPPLSNGNNDMKMSWNCAKKRTIPNTVVKYWHLHGLDLLNMQNDCFWNSDRKPYIPPPPTLREFGSSLQAVGGDPGIFQIGGRMRGLQTSKYYDCFKPLFSPFWTCCYVFLFCVAKFITDEMQVWKRILHILEKFQTIRSFTVSHLFLLCSF